MKVVLQMENGCYREDRSTVLSNVKFCHYFTRCFITFHQYTPLFAFTAERLPPYGHQCFRTRPGPNVTR